MTRKILLAITILLCVISCFHLGISLYDISDDNQNSNSISITEKEGTGIKLNTGVKRAISKTGTFEQVVTVTATPNVANAKLVWSLGFVNSSITYTPSNYVKMVISDDTLSATLTYVTKSNYQMILTVCDQSNSSVNATCFVDFNKPLSNFTLNKIAYTCSAFSTSYTMNIIDQYPCSAVEGNYNVIKPSKANHFVRTTIFDYNLKFNEVVFNPTFGTGTEKGIVAYELYLGLSDELEASLKAAGLSYNVRGEWLGGAYKSSTNNFLTAYSLKQLLYNFVPYNTNNMNTFLSALTNIDCFFVVRLMCVQTIGDVTITSYEDYKLTGMTVTPGN